MPTIVIPSNVPKLGERARDVISGFEGKITAITEEITGNYRLSLQPPVKADGTFAEAYDFDLNAIEVLDSGDSDRACPMGLETDIVLGDVVRDSASGLEGMTLARVWFINGCLYYRVSPPASDKGEIKYHLIDHQRLTVVKAAAQPDRQQKATGGPITAAPRRA